MPRAEKLLERMRANPAGWRFEQMERVLEAYGFVFKNQHGSDRIYARGERGTGIRLVARCGRGQAGLRATGSAGDRPNQEDTMKDLDFYLALPWTIRWSAETYEDGTEERVLAIEELPGFALVADTEAELLLRYRLALELFLGSYLEDGEEPPLPAAARVRSA